MTSYPPICSTLFIYVVPPPKLYVNHRAGLLKDTYYGIFSHDENLGDVLPMGYGLYPRLRSVERLSFNKNAFYYVQYVCQETARRIVPHYQR